MGKNCNKTDVISFHISFGAHLFSCNLTLFFTLIPTIKKKTLTRTSCWHSALCTDHLCNVSINYIIDLFGFGYAYSSYTIIIGWSCHIDCILQTINACCHRVKKSHGKKIQTTSTRIEWNIITVFRSISSVNLVLIIVFFVTHLIFDMLWLVSFMPHP